MTMQREVPFSVEGVGLVPEDFYRDAETVIQMVPDEWDAVAIGPMFERNADGWPIKYLGAGWYFLRGDKYAGFIDETPGVMLRNDLLTDRLDRVRYAFAKAGV